MGKGGGDQSATLLTRGENSRLHPLSEDWLTAWVPDIGGHFDASLFLTHTMTGERPAVQWLRAPKPGGATTMLVPTLHPATHVALHRATDPLRSPANNMLGEGVFGYRQGADPTRRYADDWQAFTAHTRSLAAESEAVVFADISSFFPSTPWPVVEQALRRHFSGEATDQIFRLMKTLDAQGLHYPPPGYADARLLANVVLHDVDRSIEVPWARWVDDYRLFVPAGRDPQAHIDALAKHLRRFGLELNAAKTRVRPAAEVTRTHRNVLGEVYNPERDGEEKAVAALHRLLEEARQDPVKERTKLRFALGRLTKTNDSSAVPFALAALRDIPWEAPRLVGYLGNFADELPVRKGANNVLKEAAGAGDAWLVARLAPLLMRNGLSSQSAEVLEEAMPGLTGTPTWGLALRLLALSGHESQVIRLTYDDVSDPRAALIALADLRLPLPDRLVRLEPLTAQALEAAGRAPVPSLQSLL